MIMYENKKQKLDIIIDKLNSLINNKTNTYEQRLEYLKNRQIICNPHLIYKDKEKALEVLINKLDLVNPLNVLKRGYSITLDKNKKVINSVNNVHQNDEVKIQLFDGTITTRILNIEQEIKSE